MNRFSSEGCGYVTKVLECGQAGVTGSAPESSICSKAACGAAIVVREAVAGSGTAYTAAVEGDWTACADARASLETTVNGDKTLGDYVDLGGPDIRDIKLDAPRAPRPEGLPPQ